MSEPTYSPCPVCGQYSHSIAGGLLEEAHLHFETMISHRGDGLPTQHVHNSETRDMAQRLLAELAAALQREAKLREALADLLSWFPEKAPAPEYRIEAGDRGATDAVEAGRAALQETQP